MKPTTRFQYRIAETDEDFEAIHRLNYRTFVEEIPQHDTNGDRRLVDRFHDRNTYVICLAEGSLAGMVAVRFDHPFSLEEKLGDLTEWLPPGRTWCEIRLLAVERAWRGTALAAGLLQAVAAEGIRRGCDAAIISATTRQLRLYGHMGFTPFARPVGREGAWYQPMYLLLEILRRRAPQLAGDESRTAGRHAEPVNLLPGPVRMPDSVRTVLGRPAVSHRDPAFLQEFQALRRSLAALAGARFAALLPGSGTLANEVICQRIRLLDRPGVVLSCGEFGERLADHARRSGLTFDHVACEWGTVPDFAAVERALDARPDAGWLWTVHRETSTGVTLDPDHLHALCAPRGIRLCLDCVSTIGALPVDLRHVFLASGSSGKGLASMPGIAIVFHHDPVAPEPDRVPRYLDLGLYASPEGLPFTQNGNLILALKASMDTTDWPEKFCRIRGTGDDLRRRSCDAGLPVVGGTDPAFAPGVVTFALPTDVPSLALADDMERNGCRLSAHSGYLRARNWVQACLFGDIFPGDVSDFPERLRRAIHRVARSAAGQPADRIPAKTPA